MDNLRRRLAVAGLVVALLILAAIGVSSVITGLGTEPAPAKPRPPRVSSVVRQLLEAHNKIRTDKRLPPLALNAKLCEAAQKHADWMAAHNKLTHYGRLDPWKRMAEAGYQVQAGGENVAWNQANVAEVMRSWMGSMGHRANILGHYNEIGAGVARGHNNDPYWCVDFGSRGKSGEALPLPDESEPEPAATGYLVPPASTSP